jgi:hypothetical protein
MTSDAFAAPEPPPGARPWAIRRGSAADPVEQATTSPRHEVIEHSEPTVHRWRASQLRRLGIPASLAEVYAGRIDWHQIAQLIQRGCPPRLALRIVC